MIRRCIVTTLFVLMHVSPVSVSGVVGDGPPVEVVHGVKHIPLGKPHPLRAYKGYPTLFGSLLGDADGYEIPMHWSYMDQMEYFSWDKIRDIFSINRITVDYFIEVQIRQTNENGQWGQWVNIEKPVALRIGNTYEYTPGQTRLYLTVSKVDASVVTITGDRAQIRHRINNTRWRDHPDVDVTSPPYGVLGHEWYDYVTPWDEHEIEVVSDGHETWMDVTDRGEVALAFFEDWANAEHIDTGWQRPDYHQMPHARYTPPPSDHPQPWWGFIGGLGGPYALWSEWDYAYTPPAPSNFDHLKGPSDTFRDAVFDRINFYRRYAGVGPTSRASEKHESWAQAGAFDMHMSRHMTHDRMHEHPDNPYYIPWEHPWRDYFPHRGREVRWATRGSLGWMMARTARAEGGDAYFLGQFDNRMTHRGQHMIYPQTGYETDHMGWIRPFMDDQAENNTTAGHRHGVLNPVASEYALGVTLSTYIATSLLPDPTMDQSALREESVLLRSITGRAESSGWAGEYARKEYRRELTRDNGVFFPAPDSYIPVQIMPARWSGFGVFLDHLPDLSEFFADKQNPHEYREHYEVQLTKRAMNWHGPYILPDDPIEARVWRNGERIPSGAREVRLDLRDRLLSLFSIDFHVPYLHEIEEYLEDPQYHPYSPDDDPSMRSYLDTHPLTKEMHIHMVEDYAIDPGTSRHFPEHLWAFGNGEVIQFDHEGGAFLHAQKLGFVDQNGSTVSPQRYLQIAPDKWGGFGDDPTWGFDTFHANGAIAPLYPFPRTADGVDVFEIQLVLKTTEFQREHFGLEEEVILVDYSFRVFKPHIAFSDDQRKVGDDVYSWHMGWYNVSHYPWVWIYKTGSWLYVDTDMGQKLVPWYYDPALGWIYMHNWREHGTPRSYPWFYSADYGWLMYLEGSGNGTPRWYYHPSAESPDDQWISVP